MRWAGLEEGEETAPEAWGPLRPPWRSRLVWQGWGLCPHPLSGSLKVPRLLQLFVTFARLGNHHPVIRVSARMYFVITRLVQRSSKYCFQGAPFRFALGSWCRHPHRNRLPAPQQPWPVLGRSQWWEISSTTQSRAWKRHFPVLTSRHVGLGKLQLPEKSLMC